MRVALLSIVGVLFALVPSGDSVDQASAAPVVAVADSAPVEDPVGATESLDLDALLGVIRTPTIEAPTAEEPVTTEVLGVTLVDAADVATGSASPTTTVPPTTVAPTTVSPATVPPPSSTTTSTTEPVEAEPLREEPLGLEITNAPLETGPATTVAQTTIAAPTTLPTTTTLAPTTTVTTPPIPTTTTTAVPVAVAPATVAATVALPATAAPVQVERSLVDEMLAQVQFDWRRAFPDWTVEFRGERSGIRGLTYPAEKRIELFIRPDDTAFSLLRVFTHELGHVVDVELNSNADRRRWAEQRGIADGTPWWPSSEAPDFATGAGDFAEAFAVLETGITTRSTVAGQPTAADLALMRELLLG